MNRQEIIQDALSALPEDNLLFIYPSVLDGIITNTLFVRITKEGCIQVVYEDGKIESRQATEKFMLSDVNDIDYISLVNGKEEGRKLR